MPISVVFDPPLPSDSPSTFNTKAFTLLGDLNDWSTQANALPGEVATNLSALLAAPPAIGSTTPAAGSFTTLSASGDVTLGDAATDTVRTFGSLGVGYPSPPWGSTFRSVNVGTGASLCGYDGNAGTYLVSNGYFNGAQWIRRTASGLSNIEMYNGQTDFKYAGTGAVDSIATLSTGLTISNTGAVTIPGSLSLTGGTFGYGTGAGGTVTQATSKSTAVTLNKPSGQITMNNAALAAGATVSFQCANSTVGVASVIEANVSWGPIDPANYSVRASSYSYAPGTIYFVLKNESAASLSEAVVINFQVHSGATT